MQCIMQACTHLNCFTVGPIRRSLAIRTNDKPGKTAPADSVPDTLDPKSIPYLEQSVPVLDATLGRPDVASILADLACSYANHQEIGVIVAGMAARPPNSPG